MRYFWLFILLALFAVSVAFMLRAEKTHAPAPVQPTPQTPSTPDPVLPASKDDLIVLDSPLPKATITSPLAISGKARGNWFFEGSFPISLVNWDGLIIAEGYATAQGEWMTTDYVPFTATITFTTPTNTPSKRGWLILQKDNPSGEPKFDNALEVEIQYQ
jgi:hypothetical protein